MIKCLLVSIILLPVILFAQQSKTGEVASYRSDFIYLWSTLKEDYAYWDKKQTNWDKVKKMYEPLFDTVTSTGSFILLMERVFNEFYDHHASLSSNTAISQRLVPSGTDMWAEYRNGIPVITEVRLGFGAQRVGLRAGMTIISVNDEPIELAVSKYLPLTADSIDNEARNYALRLVLAGRFTDDRKITIRSGKMTESFTPDRPVSLLRAHQYQNVIESGIHSGNIGYIKINNRLWDNGLIPLFDSVLYALRNTVSLILDLRETPSGGNTTVARAIMGSFIKREGFYQKHELTAEERIYGIKRSWLEIVSPRKFVYRKPLVVLVNHWTGSVGEGITIGFHALKRATIIGTDLARLNGAIYSYQMPYTKIGFAFPVEKLFHIVGTPRERFTPDLLVDLKKQKPNEDLILATGLHYFGKNRLKRK